MEILKILILSGCKWTKRLFITPVIWCDGCDKVQLLAEALNLKDCEDGILNSVSAWWVFPTSSAWLWLNNLSHGAYRATHPGLLGNSEKYKEKGKRPRYLLPLRPRHNTRVPPFLHSASGLCSIVLLPHPRLTEQGTWAGGQEAGYQAAESTPDVATLGNDQRAERQPSDWPLHGSGTWNKEGNTVNWQDDGHDGGTAGEVSTASYTKTEFYRKPILKCDAFLSFMTPYSQFCRFETASLKGESISHFWQLFVRLMFSLWITDIFSKWSVTENNSSKQETVLHCDTGKAFFFHV